MVEAVVVGMTDSARRVGAAARPVLLSMAKGTQVNHHDIEDLEASVVEKVLSRLASGAEINDLDVYAKQVAGTRSTTMSGGGVAISSSNRKEIRTSRLAPVPGLISSHIFSGETRRPKSSSPERTLSGTGR